MQILSCGFWISYSAFMLVWYYRVLPTVTPDCRLHPLKEQNWFLFCYTHETNEDLDFKFF